MTAYIVKTYGTNPMPLALFPSKYLKDATAPHKVGMASWIPGGSVWIPAAALALASLGCATEVSDQAVETRVTASTTDPTIFGGAKDDDGDAMPGVVALRVGTGTTFEIVPVVPSKETREVIAPYLDQDGSGCKRGRKRKRGNKS